MANAMNATYRFADSAGSNLIDLARLGMPVAAHAQAFADVHRVAEISWETGLDGGFSWCGSNMGRLLGFGLEEIVRKTPRDFMPATDRLRLTKALAAALATAGQIDGFKHQLILRGGGYCQAESAGSPVFDDLGNLKGYRFVTQGPVRQGSPGSRADSSSYTRLTTDNS